MLLEAHTLALAAFLSSDSELSRVFDMGTVNGARALGLRDYGFVTGCRADLVVFDAASEAEAIRKQAEKLHVIRAGRIVATNQRTGDVLL
jgi:cytosine deaminase